MMSKIDISSYTKAEVLCALYNASDGIATHGPTVAAMARMLPKMEIEKAEELLKERTYFDYLEAKVMKVELSGDDFDPWLYDRDNGEGAAERAIASIRGVSQRCMLPTMLVMALKMDGKCPCDGCNMDKAECGEVMKNA